MSPANESEIRELAMTLMRAAEARDAETMLSCYAPDAMLWSNISNAFQSPEDHAASTAHIQEKIKRLSYEDIRIRVFEGGYVQQHTAVAELATGTALSIPGCFVVEVVDGKIFRREEYLDPSPLAAALA